MAVVDADWSRAYAAQSLSDLRMRDLLAEAAVEKCHRLHFLQMAAEKLCKAHLTMGNGHASVRKTHAYVAKVLPVIARQFYSDEHDDNVIRGWQYAAIQRFAREIEAVAPACDLGEEQEDNSEYPWVDGSGTIQIPCEYRFPNIDDGDKTMVLLVRLMRVAASSYAGAG